MFNSLPLILTHKWHKIRRKSLKNAQKHIFVAKYLKSFWRIIINYRTYYILLYRNYKKKMRKKIMVIAPHADDEVLGCGGYLLHSKSLTLPFDANTLSMWKESPSMKNVDLVSSP